MLLRDIAPDEISRIIELEQNSTDYSWNINSLTASLEMDHECKIGADKGNDKGYFVLTHGPGFTEICNIVVFEESKRQGYGKQFLRLILQSAVARGSDKIWLEVRRSNVAARNLYRSSGFDESGFRKGYYPFVGGNTEDAILMTLPLNAI